MAARKNRELKKAYRKALVYLAACGYAHESHVALCDKNGELIP